MTEDEQRAAYRIGVARSKASRQRGSQHLVGWRMKIEQEQADGYAAVAEALVAEHVGGRWVAGELNRPDDGIDVIGPDGTQYGVRWTPLLTGGLVVREKDRLDLTFVLVVGLPPNQQIIGKILSVDARCVWYVRDDWDPPAWLVRQAELRAA